MANSSIIKSFAVKNAVLEDQSGKLCGNPSVMGCLDLYNDVIFPKAFHKCLADFLRRGFTSVDHVWHWTAIVGMPTVAEERGKDLYSEFTFHSDQASQDAKTKCKERLAAGLEVGLSIGFSMMPGQFIYFANGNELLAYAKKNGYDLTLFDVKGIKACTSQCTGIIEIEELWEYSLTPAPANQQAMAVAVKGAPGGVRLSARGGDNGARPDDTSRAPINTAPRGHKSMKLKTICGAVGLPLADEDAAWSAKDAVARLRDFTHALAEPNADFARAFVAVDGPADDFASYQMPFCDVVGGELRAVPKALMQAAGVLNGDRAGVELPASATESAKTFLSGYYAAMGRPAPWQAGASGEARWKGQYLGDYVEYSMCMAAMTQAHYALMSECGDALDGWGDYAGMGDDEKCDAIGSMFDEHKALCMSVVRAVMAGGAEETPQQAALSVRRMAAEHLSSLGDGLTYTKHARVTVDAARALIDRTKARIDMRLKDGRALSEANRQTLKDHRDALTECVGTIDDMLARTEPKADAEKAHSLRVKHLRLKAGLASAGTV